MAFLVPDGCLCSVRGDPTTGDFEPLVLDDGIESLLSSGGFSSSFSSESKMRGRLSIVEDLVINCDFLIDFRFDSSSEGKEVVSSFIGTKLALSSSLFDPTMSSIKFDIFIVLLVSDL